MKTIGEKIRDSRVRMNLTQSELAEKTGLTIRTLSKYETDAVTPRGLNLRKLVGVLGVSEAYLTNPEIEDPNYGLDETPYIEAVRQQYGKRGATELEGLLTGVQTMFAGGDIPQEDKDAFFRAVMEAYMSCRNEAKEKFTPKKYRK